MRVNLTSQKFCFMNLEAHVPERKPHSILLYAIILLRCVLFSIYFSNTVDVRNPDVRISDFWRLVRLVKRPVFRLESENRI